jgi:hypothetical protein
MKVKTWQEMIKCLNKAEDRSNTDRTYLYMQFIPISNY